MPARTLFSLFIIVGIMCLIVSDAEAIYVERDGDKTYIVDREGERWDITQAKSLGFIGERFDYGLGRNAFTPLDDSYIADNPRWVYGGLRVIGITDGSEAKAYSISKLKRHEIANSMIGSVPIAVAH